MSNGVVSNLPVQLPPILAGQFAPHTQERVEQFYFSVAAIFETWVVWRRSRHTQRAYREDVMAFVRFMQIPWPQQCASLLSVSILDVQSFRESMLAAGAVPKTLNRRISSLSSFYKYLHGTAGELRLPIIVPNPAHAQFIGRETPDPVDEIKALSATRARHLMALPFGDSVSTIAIARFSSCSCIRASGSRPAAAWGWRIFTWRTVKQRSASSKRAISPAPWASISSPRRPSRNILSMPANVRSPLPPAPCFFLRRAGGSRHGRSDALPRDPQLPGAAARSDEGNGRRTANRPCVPLYAALVARDHGDASARRHRRYPQGPGAARPDKRQLDFLPICAEIAVGIAAAKAAWTEGSTEIPGGRRLPSQMQQKHTWRTRPDPFAEVWEEIEQWLRVDLVYRPNVIRASAAERARPLWRRSGSNVATADQDLGGHSKALPGKCFLHRITIQVSYASRIFTHCRELAITINGQAFPHLIYHFVLSYSNWETGTIAIRKASKVSVRDSRTPCGNWAVCRRSIARTG